MALTSTIIVGIERKALTDAAAAEIALCLARRSRSDEPGRASFMALPTEGRRELLAECVERAIERALAMIGPACVVAVEGTTKVRFHQARTFNAALRQAVCSCFTELVTTLAVALWLEHSHLSSEPYATEAQLTLAALAGLLAERVRPDNPMDLPDKLP